MPSRTRILARASRAGADAAKFQNFQAPKIVSDYGFRTMGGQQSHQSKWKKSVFEVYQGASIPFEWTPILKETCKEAGIDYFSSPYDYEAVDYLDTFVPAHKIGSGEIDWLALARTAYDNSTSYLDRNYRGQWERSVSNFQSKHPAGSKYNTDGYKARSRLFRPKTRITIRKNEGAFAAAMFSAKPG